MCGREVILNVEDIDIAISLNSKVLNFHIENFFDYIQAESSDPKCPIDHYFYADSLTAFDAY